MPACSVQGRCWERNNSYLKIRQQVSVCHQCFISKWLKKNTNYNCRDERSSALSTNTIYISAWIFHHLVAILFICIFFLNFPLAWYFGEIKGLYNSYTHTGSNFWDEENLTYRFKSTKWPNWQLSDYCSPVFARGIFWIWFDLLKLKTKQKILCSPINE